MTYYPKYGADRDYTTNAPSYYEDLARKNELMKHLAKRVWEFDKKLFESLEEVQRILDETLRVIGDGFNEEIEKLLIQWVEDGTLDHIINKTIFGELNGKVDDVTLRTTVLEELTVKMNEEISKKAYRTELPRFKPLLPGDGVTDVTEEIQNALLNYNDVYIGEGRHVLTSELKIKRNTRLTLHPKAILIRQHDDNLITNHQKNFGGYKGEGNILIEGGTFDMNGHEFEDVGNGIALVHGDNITIRDLTILNTPKGHALEITGCKNVTVDNVKFLGYLIDTLQSNYYVEAIQIEMASPPPPGSDYTYPYITDYTMSKQITVKNCLFASSDTAPSFSCGVGQHGARHNVYFDDIVISHNRFEGCDYWGVRAFKFRNSIIEGNLIRNSNGGGIYVVTPYSGLSIQDANNVTRDPQDINDISITGNHIIDVKGKGIYVEAGGGAFVNDVMISNNLLCRIGAQSLHLRYASRANVSNNVFRESVARLFLIEFTKDCILENNILMKTDENGMFLAMNENLVVSKNLIKNVGIYGINADGDNKDLTIIDNHIVNTSQKGSGMYDSMVISTGAKDVRLIGNKFRTLEGMNVPRFGIHIMIDVDGVVRYGNDVRCQAVTENLRDNSVNNVITSEDIVL